MAMADHDPLMCEALMAWELFRRMGYGSSQIYFGFTSDRDITIEVRHMGKEACVRIGGPVPYEAEEAERRWTAIGTELNSGGLSDAELSKFWQSSRARQQTTEISMNLAALGMPFLPEQFG